MSRCSLIQRLPTEYEQYSAKYKQPSYIVKRDKHDLSTLICVAIELRVNCGVGMEGIRTIFFSSAYKEKRHKPRHTDQAIEKEVREDARLMRYRERLPAFVRLHRALLRRAKARKSQKK